MELERKHNYDSMNTHELLKVIGDRISTGITEGLKACHMQLNTSLKLAPGTELQDVKEKFEELKNNFGDHSEKEMRLLYPLAAPHDAKMTDAELRNFISGLRHEHDEIRALLFSLRTLTHQYEFPVSSTPSHKLAFAQLNELEQDFHRLMFIEEQYLFPRLLRQHRH